MRQALLDPVEAARRVAYRRRADAVVRQAPPDRRARRARSRAARSAFYEIEQQDYANGVHALVLADPERARPGHRAGALRQRLPGLLARGRALYRAWRRARWSLPGSGLARAPAELDAIATGRKLGFDFSGRRRRIPLRGAIPARKTLPTSSICSPPSSPRRAGTSARSNAPRRSTRSATTASVPTR